METTNPKVESARTAVKDALGMYGEIMINLELWQDRKVAARQAIEKAQGELARVLQDEKAPQAESASSIPSA